MIFIDVRDQNCFNASILDTVPCVHDEGNTHMATSTSTAPPVTSENELSDLEILEATVEAVTAALPFRLNPSSTAKTAGKLAKATLTQPRALARRVVSLNGEALKIAAGLSTVAPAKGDRRFADEAFENGHFYKRLAQGYLATDQAINGLLDDLDLDEVSRLRAQFLINILLSTAAPTNTILGNPAAIKKARQTKGRSLLKGLQNAVDDVRHNGAMPSMVDTKPFVVGETVAATPGAVVFANEILEVIQYTPATTKVASRPVFIVPPQINKFYILDLAPQRSMIEHLVSQGQQVFCISWRNAKPEHRHWDLDAYATAVIEGIDAAISISKSPDVNMLGVCAGGITTASILGHLSAIGDTRVNSVSFLVTVLDWDVPSTVGTFAVGPLAELAGRVSQRKGVLKGDDLAKLFAWLRPNDLIWNYVVNNYLMGNSPAPFDVLSWNVDSTDLPAGLHADFLDMGDNNALAKSGEAEVLGSKVDLKKVTCDAFVVGAVTDHITPWKACYSTVNFLGGDVEFVLSSQGHIQALVNPSGNPKGKFFTNPAAISGDDIDSETWLEGANEHPGSWWDHWSEWLSARGGNQKAAPKTLGNKAYPAGIAAPGSYVLD